MPDQINVLHYYSFIRHSRKSNTSLQFYFHFYNIVLLPPVGISLGYINIKILMYYQALVEFLDDIVLQNTY